MLKWLGRKECIGCMGRLEVIWPSEQLEGDTARTSTEPRGVSSKNGPIKVQQWGMCRWIYLSGILVKGPSLGPWWDMCKLTNVGM